MELARKNAKKRNKKERTKRCAHGGRRREGKNEEMRSWGEKNGRKETRRKEGRDALMGEEEEKERTKKIRIGAEGETIHPNAGN